MTKGNYSLSRLPRQTNDRKPVPELTENLIGKLFGDRGYVSALLFEQLFKRGLEFIMKSKCKMKNRLTKMIDKILSLQVSTD